MKTYEIDIKLGQKCSLISRTGEGSADLAKLIQITTLGYNFLDLTTNKCLMKHVMYKNDDGKFDVPVTLAIKKI